MELTACRPACEDRLLDARHALERFLAGVELRALAMARIATRDHPDALDLVQEAMIALAERYGHRPEAEWAPLFHRILEHRIGDWRRRRKVRERFRVWFGGSVEEGAGPDPLEQVADPAAVGPERILDGEAACAALVRGLQRLPDRQRQAFLLRAWEGLDTAQTALAMNCSEGSVKTHYSRAIAALGRIPGLVP